jgi:hypothetical protein
VCEAGLSELLTRHSHTLRYLELFSLGLWQGSFQGLLTTLRSTLSLKKFRLWGIIQAFHAPHEAWRIQPGLEADSESWSPELIRYVEMQNQTLSIKWASIGALSLPEVEGKIDLFMETGLISWPWLLCQSDALDAVIYRVFGDKHHTEKCKGCIHSLAEINASWNIGILKPLEGWWDHDMPEYPGIGEREIEEFYCEGGYDEDGFDREGFNQEGVHHLDISYEWQGAVNPISMVSARRLIRSGILASIPRYSQRVNRMSDA